MYCGRLKGAKSPTTIDLGIVPREQQCRQRTDVGRIDDELRGDDARRADEVLQHAGIVSRGVGELIGGRPSRKTVARPVEGMDLVVVAERLRNVFPDVGRLRETVQEQHDSLGIRMAHRHAAQLHVRPNFSDAEFRYGILFVSRHGDTSEGKGKGEE
jgi:hypothetical protein